MTGEIFVEPLLAKWTGRRANELPVEMAELTRRISSSGGDDDYIRVVLGKLVKKHWLRRWHVEQASLLRWFMPMGWLFSDEVCRASRQVKWCLSCFIRKWPRSSGQFSALVRMT